MHSVIRRGIEWCIRMYKEHRAMHIVSWTEERAVSGVAYRPLNCVSVQPPKLDNRTLSDNVLSTSGAAACAASHGCLHCTSLSSLRWLSSRRRYQTTVHSHTCQYYTELGHKVLQQILYQKSPKTTAKQRTHLLLHLHLGRSRSISPSLNRSGSSLDSSSSRLDVTTLSPVHVL